MKNFNLIILVLVLTGCNGVGGGGIIGGGIATIIPSIDFVCSASTNCGDNSASGFNFHVSLLNTTCSTAQGNGFLNSDFHAIGVTSVATCSAGTCSGNISSFKKTPNLIPATMISGDHTNVGIMSYIDYNNDNMLTTGEPYFCQDAQDITPSSITLGPAGWGNAP